MTHHLLHNKYTFQRHKNIVNIESTTAVSTAFLKLHKGLKHWKNSAYKLSIHYNEIVAFLYSLLENTPNYLVECIIQKR